jgi:hypothetical protein
LYTRLARFSRSIKQVILLEFIELNQIHQGLSQGKAPDAVKIRNNAMDREP